MGGEHHFESGFELASAVTRRDYLAWSAKKGKERERTESKLVTGKKVRNGGSIIKLTARTDGKGEYHFEIHESEESQAYFHPPNDNKRDLGSLYFAELTDRQKFVNVKEGWFDSRG